MSDDTMPRRRSSRNQANPGAELRDCAAHKSGGLGRVRELVLDEGVDADSADEEGSTPLHKAVQKGNEPVARFLLENGADANLPDHSGMTALTYAIDQGHLALVQLLLQHGAEMGELVFNGEQYVSALYFLCLYKKSGAFVSDLIRSGAVVNAVQPGRTDDHPDETPLCAACRANDLQAAQLLIQNGANVSYHDARFPGRSSPLFFAVRNKNLEVVELLLRAGARVVDDDMQVLLECAEQGWCQGARRFLKAGVDVNRADLSSGKTPLWVAAFRGDVTLVEEFIKKGANVAIRDKSGGETPLEVARRKGHLSIVNLLRGMNPQSWQADVPAGPGPTNPVFSPEVGHEPEQHDTISAVDMGPAETAAVTGQGDPGFVSERAASTMAAGGISLGLLVSERASTVAAASGPTTGTATNVHSARGDGQVTPKAVVTARLQDDEVQVHVQAESSTEQSSAMPAYLVAMKDQPVAIKARNEILEHRVQKQTKASAAMQVENETLRAQNQQESRLLDQKLEKKREASNALARGRAAKLARIETQVRQSLSQSIQEAKKKGDTLEAQEERISADQQRLMREKEELNKERAAKKKECERVAEQIERENKEASDLAQQEADSMLALLKD